MTLNRPSCFSTSARCVLTLAVSVACAASAEAKLARDLAERIAAGRAETVRSIIAGSDAAVIGIASRHGGLLEPELVAPGTRIVAPAA